MAPYCVLVDDDPEFMRFVGLVLSRVCPPMKIASFSSSLEAMGYLAKHRADLLITDFKMPIIDGLRLASHLRARNKTIPIVIMSGEEIESQALATGATAFVLKRDLLTQLAAILDRCAVECRDTS